MGIFKTFTLTWWQASAFKLGMLALGISIGAYWATVFRRWLPVLLVVAAAALGYVWWVWARQ